VHNSSLRWPVPESLADCLPGKTVMRVDRRSKYLLFNFDSGTLIVHLGMTGHLRCVSSAAETMRKHDHLELIFTDGSVMRFNDSRRFGAVLWSEADPLQHRLLSSLGPEPFSDSFNADYLYQLSRGRKVAVKPFLMDSHVVVGIGNIYANEALFRAGISPRRAAGRLTRTFCERLVKVIEEVLNEAIVAGGTTIRDFADSQGKAGYFKQELRVYGRKGEACLNCNESIRLVRQAQRATYYCPACQK
jgi:formamidopyrimidine-DNA glycosylase